MVAEALRYLKARALLAGEEAKAAGIQYGVAAGSVAGALVAGALVAVVLAYIFLIVTAVFAIGFAFDSKYAWVAVLGAAALLHLGGAVGLILSAKKRVGDAPFLEPSAELEKDRLWLRRLTAKN